MGALVGSGRKRVDGRGRMSRGHRDFAWDLLCAAETRKTRGSRTRMRTRLGGDNSAEDGDEDGDE